MNITYISDYDASDVNNWSGLGHFISKALSNQEAKLDFINQHKRNLGFMINSRKLIYKVLGKSLDLSREPEVVKKVSAQTSKLIKPNTNVIFSPSSIPVALLETTKPKVFYTDATFAGMIGFYEGFSKLDPKAVVKANFLEQQAMDSAQLIIYSSDWAAQSAIQHYNVNPSKIKIVPFGANIDSERSWEDVKAITNSKNRTECNLLFIGVDWKRKGGDVAIKITELLNNMGLKTRLHLVGNNNIPEQSLPEYITNHGFISKASEIGRDKLTELFINSHFLLLPTKADCTPIVFSEANSFGLPVISTTVGGIPTIITENVNGKTFSPNSGTQEWSNYIYSSFNNHTRYNDLCLSSYGEYQKRLNWKKAGKEIMGYLKLL
ncbi:glycosyltransferase family 4 protein [Pontibacter amylolyticus]|uniref:Glycosyl transferase n=1 Tax=Pontibacter amylolyticus TaxID=1424080 RepID=A0ABQ1W3H5_9BACT|nr:glycosyltransferase [Pontibacter amylolyticus]GGG12431.1 glycosyl transferase [Pontibacter amylolyticus]